MKHGDFTHIEIPADDPDRAKRFYDGLFGWAFQDEIPGFEGYHMFTTPAGEEGLGGAIGKRGEMAPDKVRNYVNVDSIDETLAKVTQLGGSVVEAKREVAGQGWYAVFTDTEGNELALWESPPGAQPDRRRTALALLLVLGACAARRPHPRRRPAVILAQPIAHPRASGHRDRVSLRDPLARAARVVADRGDRPAAREDHTWTVDPATGVAYLFGGRDGATVLDDTGPTTSRRHVDRARPAASPAARFGHEAAWVDGIGLVVFAGQAGSDILQRPVGVRSGTEPGRAAGRRRAADPALRHLRGASGRTGGSGSATASRGRTRFADTRAYDFETGRLDR